MKSSILWSAITAQNIFRRSVTVTLVGKNLKGEEVRNDYTVLYGETVRFYYWHEPIGMNLIGFSDTPDGEILATDPWNLPATTESAVTYYMVYASDPCEVEFFYYDPATKNNVECLHEDSERRNDDSGG